MAKKRLKLGKKKTSSKAEYIPRFSTEGEKVADAIDSVLYSDDLHGRQRSKGNLVEVIDDLACMTREVAQAISEGGEGRDATGGHIRCLTSSVMGVTKGLTMIASAISELADAVRKSKK
jgi:hypothetical protein